MITLLSWILDLIFSAYGKNSEWGIYPIKNDFIWEVWESTKKTEFIYDNLVIDKKTGMCSVYEYKDYVTTIPLFIENVDVSNILEHNLIDENVENFKNVEIIDTDNTFEFVSDESSNEYYENKPLFSEEKELEDQMRREYEEELERQIRLEGILDLEVERAVKQICELNEIYSDYWDQKLVETQVRALERQTNECLVNLREVGFDYVCFGDMVDVTTEEFKDKVNFIKNNGGTMYQMCKYIQLQGFVDNYNLDPLTTIANKVFGINVKENELHYFRFIDGAWRRI